MEWSEAEVKLFEGSEGKTLVEKHKNAVLKGLTRTYNAVKARFTRTKKNEATVTNVIVPITKVVMITDYHYPLNIPVNAFLAFCRERGNQEVILGGDMWDLGFMSHWNEAEFINVGFEQVRRNLYREADGMNRFMDDVVEANPKAKLTYIEGNHENWIKQFAQKYPQMARRDGLQLEELLEFKRRNINFIPYTETKTMGYYQVGKIHFCHGHQFGTDNIAKQAVDKCHRTVVFGHHHVYKVWPGFSFVNSADRHVGVAVPCYGTLAPAYGKGSPNAWNNGFFYASVKKSGNFSFGVQLVSHKGEFMDQYGKEYA